MKVAPTKQIVRFFNTYEPVAPLYRDVVPALASHGADVEIFVSRAEYRERMSLEESLESWPSVRIRYVTSFGLNASDGAVAKAIIHLTYVLQAAVIGLVSGRDYRNVFLTQPPFLSLLGRLFSVVHKQPYHVIVMDIQPQMSAALGLLCTGSLGYRVLYRLNRHALRHADGVVVIGRCMAETVEEVGVEGHRIRTIPNWAEASIRVLDREESILRREWDIGERMVVMFAGNIGIPQPFGDLIEVAGSLQNDDDILFVIVGEGSRKAALERAVEQRNLGNVWIYPFLHATNDISEILGVGDVHFIPLSGKVSGLAVPSKTYSILAAGRPVLFQGPTDSEVARVIDEEGLGVVVEPGDVEGLRRAIEVYQSRPELREEQGRRARQVAEGRFSRGRAIAAYMSVLAQ